MTKVDDIVKDDEVHVLPVAVATAVTEVSHPAVANGSCYVVSLPVGVTDIGIEFTGIVPMITRINFDSPINKQTQVGHYCHGIIMPNVEIINITQIQHLNELIVSNSTTTRQLLLSQEPTYIDRSTSGNNKPTGALYKHLLPQEKHLGFLMTGFPPRITSVEQQSMFFGRIHPNQVVEAVIVPNEPVFNLAAGAFTSTKVAEKLLKTSNVPGRQIVLKDTGHGVRSKGSDDPFDFGGFLNTSSWGLGRMFGKKK